MTRVVDYIVVSKEYPPGEYDFFPRLVRDVDIISVELKETKLPPIFAHDADFIYYFEPKETNLSPRLAAYDDSESVEKSPDDDDSSKLEPDDDFLKFDENTLPVKTKKDDPKPPQES